MERQIAIMICVFAIIGFAFALRKNNALSNKGVVAVIIIAGGIGGMLATTL